MAPILPLGLAHPDAGLRPGRGDRGRPARTACGGAEALAGPPGAAAARKLLRSVFYKGMAAALVEALRAAQAAGCADWLREHIAAELAAADETPHAPGAGHLPARRRRVHEMAAASDMLAELGVPPGVARASQQWLEELGTD